jgi:acetate kinase
MPETEDPLLLAVNAGSSSLKAKLFALRDSTLSLNSVARLDGIGRRQARLRIDDVGFSVGAVGDHARAAEVLLDRLLQRSTTAKRLVAIGHRIVHGGVQFTAPIRITRDVWQQLEALRELAPLHNPPALAIVRATAARYPNGHAVLIEYPGGDHNTLRQSHRELEQAVVEFFRQHLSKRDA